MRKRTLGAAVGALALSIAVTGCGSGNNASDVLDAAKKGPAASAPAGAKGQTPAVSALAAKLGSSRAKLDAANSVSMTMDMKIDGKSLMTMSMDTRLLPTMAMKMKMKFGDAFTDMMREFDGEESGGGLADMPEVQALITADAMYVSMGPKIGAEKLGGKNWVKMSLADMEAADDDGSLAEMRAMMEQGATGQQHPAAQMALLLKSPSITEVGQETVDGVKATHYRGAIDKQLVDANTPETLGLSKADYDRLRKDFAAMGDTGATIDIWVGADQLPVKQVMTMTVDEDGERGKIEVEGHFANWGEPVDLTPPPAADTVAWSPELEKQLDEL